VASPAPSLEPSSSLRAHAGGTAEEGGFFASLPEISDFGQVTQAEVYREAPATWSLALTDVRGSTRAIEAGRYRDVNALGVASIVAVCNALPDVDVPYVFGGDGATLLVPGSRAHPTAEALRGVARLAHSAYGLELRVGVVPLAELSAAGHSVRVARFRPSRHVSLAMFAGSGIAAAERWLKDPGLGAKYLIEQDGDGDACLDGFECRWQPVQSRRGAIVSLLVLGRAATDEENALTYRAVLSELTRITSEQDLHPLDERRLKLPLFGDFSTEARLMSRGAAGPEATRAEQYAQKKARIGRLLIGLGASAGGFDGRTYVSELVENTDFRKFDGMLRMVLDLSESHISELTQVLEQARTAGRLSYGIHRAPSALVTCFVRSYAGNHLHFVDGADGGYALAAKNLKAQLR
jgi:hypothetical protein